jgi:hypothetical protein
METVVLTERDEPSANDPAAPDRYGLIVGAMKCGTTSLFNYLADHPQVAPSRAKEPNYFCADDYREGDRRGYESLWSWEPGVHRIAIEASVNYTKMPSFPNCAERIAAFPCDAFRFVYCMRNPIDRIESHVYHGQYAGWTQPLDDGLSDHTLDVSRYAMQLDAYVEHFGRERIHLLVLERFQQAPEAALREVCRFLEIDPDFHFPRLEAAHNTASAHYVEHPAWNRLRALEPVRRLAHAVPRSWRQRLSRATGRTLETRRRLTPEERRQIASELAADLDALRERYGIDARKTWGIEPS